MTETPRDMPQRAAPTREPMAIVAAPPLSVDVLVARMQRELQPAQTIAPATSIRCSPQSENASHR